MARLTQQIPSRKFELILARIGEILADEIAYQEAQFGKIAGDNNVQVWKERIIDWNAPTEFPAVNVGFGGGPYTGKDQTINEGNYTFYIDCHVNAKSKETEDSETEPSVEQGDTRAADRLLKLLGVCQAILDSPFYCTLGYAAPFNCTMKVDRVLIHRGQEADALNGRMGRLEVFVKAPETVQLVEPTLLGEYVTQVKLYSTNKGYYWGPLPGVIDEDDSVGVIDEDSTPILPQSGRPYVKISEFELADLFDGDSLLTGLVPDGSGGYENKNFTADQIADYLGTGSQTIDRFVFNEVLTGTVNGSNATFTTQFDFVPGTTKVQIQGVELRIIDDYQTIGTNTIQFVTSPLTGEVPVIDYIKQP